MDNNEDNQLAIISLVSSMISVFGTVAVAFLTYRQFSRISEETKTAHRGVNIENVSIKEEETWPDGHKKITTTKKQIIDADIDHAETQTDTLSYMEQGQISRDTSTTQDNPTPQQPITPRSMQNLGLIAQLASSSVVFSKHTNAVSPDTSPDNSDGQSSANTDKQVSKQKHVTWQQTDPHSPSDNSTLLGDQTDGAGGNDGNI